MDKLDYKKAFPALYLQKAQPALVDVPEMPFFQVAGSGNPNESPAYKAALEMLYGLSFTVKMSKMDGSQPAGYFEYVMPPLEGLWWMEGMDGIDYARKEEFRWIAMIRQPDFVTEAVFDAAREKLARKKPGLDLERARFARFREGLCAQALHTGPYDDEPATLARLHAFIAQSGCAPDYTQARRHHEIYLSDPRKTAPQRLKTIVRLPVRRV